MNRATTCLMAFSLSVSALACAGPEQRSDRGQPQLATIEPVVYLGLPGARNSTPSLASLDDFVAVVWTAATGETTDVYAATSKDGGRTFSEATRVNDVAGDVMARGELPPRVAVSRAGGSERPELAVAWASRLGGAGAIRGSRSTDGGATFSPAITLHEAGAPGNRGWQSIAMQSDGTVHVAWIDERPGASTAGRAAEARHHPGGAGQDAHRRSAQGHERPHHASPPRGPRGFGHQPSGLMYSRWAGDGVEDERLIAPDVCECCKTAMAAAADGTIYTAWRQIFPGSIRDIAFARAREGRRFDPPIRVSEDGWELNGCPDDGPAIVVDRAGRIHVVWPTLVTDDGEPRKGIFHAMSLDGQVFLERQRVSASGSNPSHPQIALAGNGGVVALWDEMDDGRRRVMMREIASDPDTAPAMSPPIELSAEASASYPVGASTHEGLVVAWTSTTPEQSRIAIRRVR